MDTRKAAAATTLIYLATVSCVAVFHEPWADEAQAWLLARDLGPWKLLFGQLRYEGHPGLWHQVLMLPAKTLPYRALSVLAVAVAASGALVFFRRAPLPIPLRFAFPFTYFLFYQYAVIARSYVLLPLLFFGLATVYPRRVERPIPYAGLLALIAYTSVYTAFAAIAIMGIYSWELAKSRLRNGSRIGRDHLIALTTFAAVILLIAIQLWPPDDGSFARGFNTDWRHWLTIWSGVLDRSMIELPPLSWGVLAVSLVWFWRRNALALYALPTLSVLVLFAGKYHNSWHEGILFLLWLFAVWISFYPRPDDEARRPNRLRYAMIAACSLVIVAQVRWSVIVSAADFSGRYSAGEAVASYIRESGLEHADIRATTFWSTAVQPYFDANVFRNHNGGKRGSFWFWAVDNRREERIDAILAANPDLIVIGRPKSPPDDLPGYRLVDVFEGSLFWKDRVKETNHLAVYRRKADQ